MAPKFEINRLVEIFDVLEKLKDASKGTKA
jgi:hypothetical protein